MKTAVLLATSLYLLSQPYGSCEGKRTCKNNPKILGSCYAVHGRLSSGADTVELRLWPVGTRRMLGVSDGPNIDDANHPIFPTNMSFPNAGEPLYGDFEVCPFSPQRKGEMQFVCIESAKHLVSK